MPHSFVRLGATLFGLMSLAACASLSEPTVPGETGRLQIDGKTVVGSLYVVQADWADRCRVDGREAWRKGEDGTHQFIFRPGVWSNPSMMSVECSDGGRQASRRLATVFDEETFRSTRTSSTIAAALISGPLALLTGPMVSEMQRDAFKFPPVLVHVRGPDASEATREAEREAAVARWARLTDRLQVECSKTGPERKAFYYSCNTSFVPLLRAEDLKAFD